MTEILGYERAVFNDGPFHHSQASLPPRVRAIVYEVCAKHGLEPAVVLGESARRVICAARHEAMRRVRSEIVIAGRQASFPQIGKWFGRDHTTVMAALRNAP